MSIPNMISIFRIILLPFFVYSYFFWDTGEVYLLSAGILLLSGLTDVVDGFIARRFNMITQLGRFLDPLADKLTQATVCVAIAIQTKALIFFPVVYIGKEILMTIGGILLTRKKKLLMNSKWFGKLATFSFYVCTFLIVLLPGISLSIALFMVGIVLILAFFSLINYFLLFKKLVKLPEEAGNPAV